MRLSFALVLLLPSLAPAQTEEMLEAVQKKLDGQRTAKWILSCEAPGGGFYLAPRDPRSDAVPRASLRATNGGVKALKYLGAEVPNKQKHAEFVLSCYDPKTGAFAEPGGKPDVTITSIGVMAAAELGVPHEKYAKAMDYLKENARTFEEVRIGAAAVEAWGVKECPFKLDEWKDIAFKEIPAKMLPPADGGARLIGSLAAFSLRLGVVTEEVLPGATAKVLNEGQREDGGWGKKGEKASDIDSTYRVMRAMYLLKEKPKDVKKLREFVAARRNKDGGYATEPGGKSSMSGAYYAAIITHWLDELEKK